MELRGQRALNRRIDRALNKIEDGRPMFRMMAQSFERSLKSNMTTGLDPDGGRLAPVQSWTRRIRAGIGKSVAAAQTPLVATGQLRNSIGAATISKRSLRLGFHGAQSAKAERMTFGIPSMMRVREDRIKTSSSGEKYLAVKIGGQWVTFKQGAKFTGTHIRIRPQKRRFFYLGSADYKQANRILDRYVTI